MAQMEHELVVINVVDLAGSVFPDAFLLSCVIRDRDVPSLQLQRGASHSGIFWLPRTARAALLGGYRRLSRRGRWEEVRQNLQSLQISPSAGNTQRIQVPHLGASWVLSVAKAWDSHTWK